jgi:hypothetical protein
MKRLAANALGLNIPPNLFALAGDVFELLPGCVQ